MKRVIILGGGRQGVTCAEFLKSKRVDVTIIDADDKNIVTLKKSGFNAVNKTLNGENAIAQIIKGYDLSVSALPARFGRIAQISAIKAKVNMVDLSYAEENPLELHADAKKAEITIIPDTGIAPGISNLLAGRIYKSLDIRDEIKIYVGGMPEKNLPPLGYTITWSPEDLISEYEREALIVKNRKRKIEKALTGSEEIKFKGFEPMEAFYTDGLRTLVHTLKGVKNLEEKTVRYHGHIDKIKFLFEMGYFEKDVNGLSPRIVSLELMKRLKYTNVRDILVMRVSGKGSFKNRSKSISYEVIDYADKIHSAMERTTGYACASFAYLLLNNGSIGKGIVTPEEIGFNEMFLDSIISSMKGKGVIIRRQK